MRNASKYLHSLADLRALDAANLQIGQAVSVATAHAARRDAATVSRIKHAARIERARAVEYTEADIAWFRAPVSV